MKRSILILFVLLGSITGFAKEPVQPDSYNYQRGVELVQNENFDEAITFLEKELSQNPKSGYAQAWLAAAYAHKDERGNAIHYLSEAQKYIPKSDKYYHAWAYNLRGTLYLEMKDTLNALDCFSSSIKTQPKEQGWYERRGEVYRELKRWAESDADFEKYIELTPGIARGYIQLAYNLYLQKRYEEALARYQYAHQLAERSFTYGGMAECEAKLGRFEDAADHVIQALEAESYESSALNVISNCRDEEFVDKMKAKFKLQLLKNPNAVEWYIYQAVFYYANQNYEEAIRAAKQAGKLNPSADMDEMISDLYYHMGDYPNAIKYINKAIDADTASDDYLENRISIYSQLAPCDSMYTDLQTIIDRNPDNKEYYGNRAYEYLFAGEYQKAIDDYDLVLAIDNNDNWARYMRARCFQCMGDSAKAQKEFQRVLKNATDANTHLFVMASLGMKEEVLHYGDSLNKADSTKYRYNVACAYALVGEKQLAMDEIEKELRDGYAFFLHLTRDPDLQSLHGTEWDQMIDTYRQQCQERIARFNSEQTEKEGEEQVVEVPFSTANGVTKVDCTINGLPLNFVFDTGASEVSISQTEANFMYKNGYLSKKDIIGKQQYLTADGSISVGTTIMLNKINFGGLELTGIRASVVSNQKAPLLLGQTILQRLGKIEIDNERKVLKITTKK